MIKIQLNLIILKLFFLSKLRDIEAKAMKFNVFLSHFDFNLYSYLDFIFIEGNVMFSIAISKC